MANRFWVVLFLAVAGARARGADFTGKYSAAENVMSVELKSGGGDAYTGTVTAGGQTLNLTATGKDEKISGSFVSGGNTYKFDGTLAGDRLTFVTGGVTYLLDRPTAAVAKSDGNPLGAGSATAAKAGAAPAAADHPAAEAIPPEGKVLATNDAGKTLFFEQVGTKNINTAVDATTAALTRRLGQPVVVEKRFEDSKHPGQGMAGFTAILDGKLTRGSMLYGPTDTGEGVSVVYAKAGCTVPQKAQLLAALPGRAPMVKHDFPDGTGSIDLPDGWTTATTSLFGDVHVKGPGEQRIDLGVSFQLAGEKAPQVKMWRQNVAGAKRMNMAPPPPLKGVLLGEFEAPADCLKTLIPQFDKISRDAGQPGMELDQITDVQPSKAFAPDGKAQFLDYLWFKGDKPNAVHLRSYAQAETADLGYGASEFKVSAIVADADRFDEDAATMYAIIQSIKTDPKVMQERFEQKLQQMRDLTERQRQQMADDFAAGQRRHEEQLAGYAKHNQEWRDRNAVYDKLHKDYIEYVRGYRTVEDTATGKQVDVDLGQVDQVVDDWNKADPGRFKQIKNRDK